MTIQFDVYTDLDINEYMEKHYGNVSFEVIRSIPSQWSKNVSYLVRSFDGMVINQSAINLGYFDDYRPGISCVVSTPKGFVTVTYSGENENCKSVIDAPDEMKQAYKNHVAYQRRKVEVQRKIDTRNGYINASREMGYTNYHIAKKLHRGLPDQYYEAVKLVSQFRNGKLRSEFRASLAAQIFNWLMDPNPQYKSPLSPKQASYLMPRKYY